MKLNNIEKFVIKQFLYGRAINIKDKDSFFADLSAKDRYFSGVGFITDLNHAEKLKVGDSAEKYTGGDIDVKLNSSIDTGYLFYVENGYLRTIEGYTYGESWPGNIFKIELCSI